VIRLPPWLVEAIPAIGFDGLPALESKNRAQLFWVEARGSMSLEIDSVIAGLESGLPVADRPAC
jgi:hypothetical protein